MSNPKTIYLPGGEIASMIDGKQIVRNLKFEPEVDYPPPEEKSMTRLLNMLGPFSQTFGFSPFGFPQAADFPGQAMLSNMDTVWHNLRWYFISNFRQVIAETYVEYGIVRKAVDVPVDDAYRGGITIKTSQLNEDQVKKLLLFMNHKRDLNIASRTQKWARLFGGAGTLILCSDDKNPRAHDPLKPFDISAIGPTTKVEFRAVDLWELFWTLQNTDGYNNALQLMTMENFNYYGENIHKSRVLRVNGMEIPSFVRPRFRGWGASILEMIIRPLNQYLKHSDVVFEVIDEFKLDVFMIDGFMQAMSDPQGEQLMMKRIEYANGRKNFQNATILDAKDKFEQRQLTFAGLSDILKDNRIGLCAELGFPLTKLFGLSATGFNAGEEDLENYNMMVEGTVRDDSMYLVMEMTKIRCQQLFQMVPDDLEIEFKPLRVLSSVDEQTVKTQKATVLTQMLEKNVISKLEARQASNSGNLVDVRLEVTDEAMQKLEDELMATNPTDTEEEPGSEGKPKASDEGGAPKGEIKPGKGEPEKPNTTDPKHPKGLKRHNVSGENMTEFENEKAEFEAAGGANLYKPEELQEALHVGNGPIWEKAKEVSKAALGLIKWPFVNWWYKKHGG